MHTAAQAMGLKGLVLCFDEFEDIIYKLRGIKQKKMAFCNLFDLFYGHHFRAHAYFAVTPGFAQKCKRELLRRGEYDYDFSQFDGLKQFQMSPIGSADMELLIQKIAELHRIAFSWNYSHEFEDSILSILNRFASDLSQDRVRQCIRHVVQELDRGVEG
jgi:hypothetical protein